MPGRRNTILLCLIQCGETAWDLDHRLLGATDLPLSDTGRSAVSAAAARLDGPGFGLIHHPPDEAATETARIFAEAHGAKVKVAADLADPNLGLLEGMTEQVFAERFPRRFKQWQNDPLSLLPPEGEDLSDSRARLLGAVARLLRRSKQESISIVLHALGLGFVRCWLSDRPDRSMWTILQERPRVERYVLTGAMIDRLEEAAARVPAGT